MDFGNSYGTTVKVALTDCKVLAPVRPVDEVPTAMNDVKVKVSPISALVSVTNSAIVLESVFGAILITFDCRRNESPELPVPVTVT